MEQRGWIALGAASALGLGVLAGAAVSAATAMPLVDSSESVSIAPITNAPADGRGTPNGGDRMPSASPSAAPSSSPGPSSSPTPSATSTPSPTTTQAPAPQPVPVAPAPQPTSVQSVDDDGDDSSDDG